MDYVKQQIDMPNSDKPARPVVVARQCSPSAARNRGPILEVLTRVLPETGSVLEIGADTGEHVVHFAKALPRLVWLAIKKLDLANDNRKRPKKSQRQHCVPVGNIPPLAVAVA